MKLREILRYELQHRLRSPTTWFCVAFLLGLSLMISLGGASPSNTAVHSNAPSLVAFMMVLLSIPGLAVSAVLFGDAAVRDVHAEMDPLLFTAPLRKRDYLLGRFLAAVAVNAAVLLAIPVGHALPLLLGFTEPGFSSGPFRIGAYAQPYLLILLPNTIFAGAVLFTTGVLARRIIPVYLSGIGLFVLTMLSLGPDADDVVNPVLSVLGPLGFHALNEHTAYWTVAEQNAQLIGFPVRLVLNRLVWLAVSALILAVLHWRFRFAHPDGGRRRERRRMIVDAAPAMPAPVAVPRVAGTFDVRTTVRQTLAVARNSFAELVGNRWFAVVMLACVGLTLLWGWNVGDTVFESSTWPVTFLVAGTVLGTRIVPFVYVLIVVYAGELVWQDRDVHVAEIADAAPVPDTTALLGRFLALVAVLVLVQAATLLGGILIQAFQGYTHFEPWLYLRIVFGLNLADYVLLAALAMTIHVVVNHKYIGHLVVLLALFFIRVAPWLGIRHNLLIFGGDPGWTYSDMNGFGPYIEPFVWFKLYWASWALLLAVAATVLWVRGHEPGGMRRRLDLARIRFTGPVVRLTGIAIALIVLLGGFIFYNTNILNDYVPEDEQGATLAEYEKRYARFADVPQPTIVSAGLRVEIHPDEPAVDLRGSFRLVNRTDAPIDSVHVQLFPGVRARTLSFDRPARAVLEDEATGYRIFALEQALEPGASSLLSFDVSFRPRGFTNDGLQTDVAGNGTYFNRRWLPIIGYQPALELIDDDARARFGLAPRQPMPDPAHAGANARLEGMDGDRVQVEAIIGTAADQIAITPGVLHRSWMENGRRYFHYETETPTSFSATIFSARYDVFEDRWNDVALQILHHPTHTHNLDRMMHGMKAALEYYTQRFGPYPDRQLRIVEVPRYDSFGRAHPHTIAFSEDHLLGRVKEGEFDRSFFGTAHEVAHMWWGGQVKGAWAGGIGFLSESLANYSAMMVAEATFGSEAVRRVYDYQMDRYLTMRTRMAQDQPLRDVERQPYIFYGKGAVAMYLLRDHIGADAVDTALRRYHAKFSDPMPPYATSLDLIAELRAVTPASLQYLIIDLFETVTLWDVETERAVMEETAAGEYRVTLDVVARKMRADSIGNETDVPMEDLVEIGVFARGEGNAPGEPLYLERHRIRSGEQTITVIVPREPARAGIDPYRKLIDRERGDNVVQVETGQ
ncbi:MAG TPA: M1 family aminopeptidase [Longimicrobiales bacterium]